MDHIRQLLSNKFTADFSQANILVHKQKTSETASPQFIGSLFIITNG